MDHVWGFTVINDVTARDIQNREEAFVRAKGYDTFAPLGPCVATGLDPEALTVETHVNGELRKDDSPATMKYSVEYQIHYLSTFCELQPGDVIYTGTPTGAGARFDPPRYLAPGDVVEVEVEGIGVLRNGVEDER